jgi:hypothetical protein
MSLARAVAQKLKQVPKLARSFKSSVQAPAGADHGHGHGHGDSYVSGTPAAAVEREQGCSLSLSLPAGWRPLHSRRPYVRHAGGELLRR